MAAPRSHALYWQAALLLGVGYAVLRGIRFPNLWSYSHYLFNYDAGFIKRGLVGAFWAEVGGSWALSYSFFVAFSVVLLVVNLVLLIRMASTLLRTEDPLLRVCTVAFASSLGLVFLAHTVGYFDHIGLLVTLVALQLAGFYRKLLFVSLAFPVVLLIHEGMLVLFFPVIFMALLFSLDTTRLRQVVALGAWAAAMLLLVLFIGNYTLESGEAQQMYVTLQTQVEPPLREDAFAVLHRDASDNAAIMRAMWTPTRVQELVASLGATTYLMLLLVAVAVARLWRAPVPRWWVGLTVLAALAPLVLHALAAWDMHRWNTMAITTSFLMLYLVVTATPTRPAPSTGRWVYGLFAGVLAANVLVTVPLFDGYQVRQYPFVEHVYYLQELIQGDAAFPRIPSR